MMERSRVGVGVLVSVNCRRHGDPAKLDGMLAALAGRAKAKADAQSDALAVVDGAGPVVPVVAKAVPVVAKAKAVPVVEKAVLAVAKAVPVGAKAVPAMLGCSTCRGSPQGCVQCRNPNYSGKRFQAKSG